jgi:hypothetical protein
MSRRMTPERRFKMRNSQASPEFASGEVGVHTMQAQQTYYGRPVVPPDLAGLFESLVPKPKRGRPKKVPDA